MSPALFAALFFTVALLVTTAYFIMGSLPLLVLKHDTPLDARFVRSFFNTYYVCAFVTATATAITFASAGRMGLAAGAAALALMAIVLRKKIIPRMDALGAQIESSTMEAIAGFRRTHITAIAINVAKLVGIVWMPHQLEHADAALSRQPAFFNACLALLAELFERFLW